MRPEVQGFHDRVSGTWTYLVRCPATGEAAVIDPVQAYDPVSGRLSDEPLVAVRAALGGVPPRWILETHAHADHVSGAQLLQAELGGEVAIGEGIRAVQATFRETYGIEDEFIADGSQFDRLLADDEEIALGELRIRVLRTPGHTDDSVTYLIGDAAFVGDTMFMPDAGTARCDFPGGDAGRLYDSIQRILALPDDTRVFVCHDYPVEGQEPRAETSVAAQREGNRHVGGGVARETYVATREARDATLDLPRLIHPSVQLNIRAGELPPADGQGRRYLRIPLTPAGS